MKKTNKKKYWEIIRIIFYMVVFLFGAYLMVTESRNQYVTKESLYGVLLFIIAFCLFVWQALKLYFSTKILHKKIQNTKTVLERTEEKTDAASKEIKEIIELVKKN